MARGRFYHDPSRKHIEEFQDFSGGLNTMSTNDNVKDNELTDLQNVDLTDRGSIKRRHGFKSTSIDEITGGKAQGIFKHRRNYTPYNLIGIEGEFDGAERTSGRHPFKYIGDWYIFGFEDYDEAFKVPRENTSLVTNGNFENGSTNGWNIISLGSEIVHIDNRYALKLERDHTHRPNDTGPRWRNEYQSQLFDTKEGEEFYIEAYFKKAGNKPERVHLIADIRYENNSRYQRYISFYENIDDWTKVSGFFKMPKGAKYVNFGVGMFDKSTTTTTSVYATGLEVLKKQVGTDDNALALVANKSNPHYYKGAGIALDGIKENTYYVFLVDFKSDGQGIGGMTVRDERFGQFPEDDKLFFERKPFDTNPTEWTTKYIKFKSYEGMQRARAIVYNLTRTNYEGTVFFDRARLYEVTPEVYDKIDKDPEYTGDALGEKFPYRSGMLQSEVIEDTIVAVNGTFYVNGKAMPVEDNIPIQSDRTMEAVSYGDNLFIASGSGLLVYNGSTIARVVPYNPDPLETLYIGTNGLMDNPYSVVDEESHAVTIQDIKFSRRYGVANEFTTIHVGVAKPGNMALEYKFERRNVRDKEGYWFTIRDWDHENHATFITDVAGEYQFKISVREKTDEEEGLVLHSYVVPRYIIKPSEEDEDVPIDANTIHTCNRILLHWDRILLYGDVAKPDVMYISDLNNPAYFPTNNTLQFRNPRKERITSIVRYRDNLVVFTPSSIQALYGTNPEDFHRVMLNTDVGCIADRAAKVVKNYIVFPSFEGIALLKTIGLSETRSNVELIDGKISNIVPQANNAVAYVRDNQYCIVYPNDKLQLRYYYEWDVWVKDISDSLDFTDVIVEHGKLTALGTDGRIIEDSNDYQDEDIPFLCKISTKDFFFSEPYSLKKLREAKILYETDGNTNALVRMWVEDNLLRETEVTLDSEEEMQRVAIAGRGLYARLDIEHEENKPFRLDGIGIIFKLKKP